MHTTNYYNTFIEVAEDCPAIKAEIPPVKGEKRTVANLQFDLLYNQPYQYTSDEILFSVFAQRKGLTQEEIKQEKEAWHSKGQPCFRASPLTKRYGWGIHADKEGKLAIFARESEAYNAFLKDDSIIKKKAMRSKRAKK